MATEVFMLLSSRAKTFAHATRQHLRGAGGDQPPPHRSPNMSVFEVPSLMPVIVTPLLM